MCEEFKFKNVDVELEEEEEEEEELLFWFAMRSTGKAATNTSSNVVGALVALVAFVAFVAFAASAASAASGDDKEELELELEFKVVFNCCFVIFSKSNN